MEKAREGLLARESGRYEDAAKAFELIVAASPGFIPAHLNLGLARHHQGEYAKAAVAFEAALQLDSNLKDVRPLLGYDLASAGRFARAVEVLERATRETRPTADTQYALGLAYLRIGEYTRAIDWLEQAIDESPLNPELLRLSADAYAGLARSRRERLLQSAPDSASARIVMAQQATASRLYADAIALYQDAMNAEPGRADVRVPLGDLYMDAKQYERAALLYQSEFEARPGYALAAERWGEALLLLGKSAEAVDVLDQAVALDKSAVSARSLLGKALTDVGELGPAERILVSVIAADPPPDVAARTHYQLGLIYRKLERPEKAREQLQLFQALQQQLLDGSQQ